MTGPEFALYTRMISIAIATKRLRILTEQLNSIDDQSQSQEMVTKPI